MQVTYLLLSMLLTIVTTHRPKQHCGKVKPLTLPTTPFTGRWYIYASTPCHDSQATKYRLGLFNNHICKCEVVDFYSNGHGYVQNSANYFIDYAYNEGTKHWDQTVIDYYILNSTYSESNLGVYSAQSRTYYDDGKMHGGSSSSSSSSSEEKKKHHNAEKHIFFFTCLDNQPEYKVFYVCTRFHHLTNNKPVVWILTKSAKPAPSTVEQIKTCFNSNNINIYDGLTFIDHSTCNYTEPQGSYGGYSYNG